MPSDTRPVTVTRVQVNQSLWVDAADLARFDSGQITEVHGYRDPRSTTPTGRPIKFVHHRGEPREVQLSQERQIGRRYAAGGRPRDRVANEAAQSFLALMS